MKPALLIIDIQNKWLDSSPGLKECLGRRVKTINLAIALFRKNNLPIIRVYHVDKEGGPAPGTKEYEFFSSIEIDPMDTQVIKNYPNAFNKTDLAKILTQNKVDMVILSGLSATGCVMATYIGAEDNDIHPFLLRDGVAADSEEKVKFVEGIFDKLSLESLVQALKTPDISSSLLEKDLL